MSSLEDIREFIKASLAPAVVSRIDVDRETQRARVLVASDQLSLAIGKRGQNVHLASKLVGWEIDVRTREAIQESLKEIGKLKSVSARTANLLVDSGYSSIGSLVSTSEKDLAKIKGIGQKKALRIIEEAKKYIKKEEQAPKSKENT